MYNKIENSVVQVTLLDKNFDKIKTVKIETEKDNFQESYKIETVSQTFNILYSKFNGDSEIASSDNIKYYLSLCKYKDEDKYYLALYSKNSITRTFSFTFNGFKYLFDLLSEGKERTQAAQKSTSITVAYLYLISLGEYDKNNYDTIMAITQWKKALLARIEIFED